MNRSLVRRLLALERRFPKPPPDLSAVPMRDLEALERQMESALARTSDDWESALSARLQRILYEAESEDRDRNLESRDDPG